MTRPASTLPLTPRASRAAGIVRVCLGTIPASIRIRQDR